MVDLSTCTATEVLDEVEYEDVTLFVRLICKQASGVRLVKDNIPVANAKFETSDGSPIQVTGWREMAEFVSSKFRPDRIYEIGPVMKTSSKRFGEYKLGYELIYHDSSTYTDLGTQLETDQGVLLPLEESRNVDGKIIVEVFVQTSPFTLRGATHFSAVGGRYRVAVKCNGLEDPLERGDRVEIKGRYNGPTLVAENVTLLAQDAIADEDPQLASYRPPPRRVH